MDNLPTPDTIDSHIQEESNTVLLNGQLFSLEPFHGDGLKDEFAGEKYDQQKVDIQTLPVSGANLVPNPDGTGMILDTRGLVLSVTEGAGGQFTLTNVENGEEHICEISDQLQTPTQLISTGENLVVHTKGEVSQFFQVTDNHGTQELSEIDVSSLALPESLTPAAMPPQPSASDAAVINQPSAVVHTTIEAVPPMVPVQVVQVAAPVNTLQAPLSVNSVQVPQPVNTIQLPPPVTCVLGDTRERKKGGWPKGKRRKPERESHAPKPPATAYVIYAVQRRQELKLENPGLPFVEATKVLGLEWSSMSQSQKQKYMNEAEADKKRYMVELEAYQQSEPYQNYLKRKKRKQLCEDGPSNGQDGSDSSSVLNELEEEGLYCAVCDQYFSSMHNRKEHMFGNKHLQNITGEFEKELQQSTGDAAHGAPDPPAAAGALVPDCASSDSDHSIASPTHHLTQPESHGQLSSLINNFIQNFLHKNTTRDLELQTLSRFLEASRQHNLQLLNKIEVYKDITAKLEQQLGNVKAYGAALSTQIDTLRMVPMLFGVVNKWAM